MKESMRFRRRSDHAMHPTGSRASLVERRLACLRAFRALYGTELEYCNEIHFSASGRRLGRLRSYEDQPPNKEDEDALYWPLDTVLQHPSDWPTQQIPLGYILSKP